MCVSVCVCIRGLLVYPGQMSLRIMSSCGPSFVHTKGYGAHLGPVGVWEDPASCSPQTLPCLAHRDRGLPAEQ